MHDQLDLGRPRVSLNLGGGGTRGLSHIGVLKALHEYKIEFDIIIGVSMGAIMGLNYALNPDPEALEKKIGEHLKSEKFKDTLLGSWKKIDADRGKSILTKINQLVKKTGLVGRLLLTKGVLSDEDVEDALFPLIPDVSFSDLKKQFICIAVNLKTGLPQVFNEGKVRDAVLASASMPLVFPPVNIKGTHYADGGILDKIGIDTAMAAGVKKILAVDPSNSSIVDRKISSALDVMIIADDIASMYRKSDQLKDATVVISPIDQDIHWADYSSFDKLIEVGYRKTVESIPEIMKKIKPRRKGFFSFFRK